MPLRFERIALQYDKNNRDVIFQRDPCFHYHVSPGDVKPCDVRPGDVRPCGSSNINKKGGVLDTGVDVRIYSYSRYG